MKVSDLNAGKAGEHLVCADLILKGYEAFLSDQGLPYDVVADINGRLMKIQVKTTRDLRKVAQRANHTSAYIFHINRCGKGGLKRYTDGVDLFALVALDSHTVGYLPPNLIRRTMLFRAEHLRGKYHDEKINARRESILVDHAAGMRNFEIAEKYGMNRSVVTRTIKHPEPVKITNATYLSELSLERALNNEN